LQTLNVIRVLVAALALAAALALPAGAVSKNVPTTTATYHVTFSGSGGGRYLDVTRWLSDAGRECYAKKVADETLDVSWTLGWNVTVMQRGPVLELRSATPTQRIVQGGVRGDAVRDFCDEPDEGLAEVGPDWPGTTQCDGPMQIVSRGKVTVSRGSNPNLMLRGPVFGSPPRPCELDVRNDQLETTVALHAGAVRNLAGRGESVTIPVGTRHPTKRKSYTPTRLCSHFPHVYDGIVYLYDCEDTLTWDGSVTLTRIR
jgi:hypothetical protein